MKNIKCLMLASTVLGFLQWEASAMKMDGEEEKTQCSSISARQNNNSDVNTNNNSEEAPDLSLIIKRLRGPLDLTGCSIDDDLACNIAEVIKDSPYITQVHLNNNNIGNKGIKALAQSFKTMKLTHLYLAGNPIDDDGFEELFTALKEVKSLVGVVCDKLP